MIATLETTEKQKMTKEKFELIAGGHAAFQLFWAGIDLGLFNLLSKKPGLTEDEVRQELELQRKPVRILIAGLVTLGLIERSGDSLRNCELVEKYLVDGKPNSMSPIFAWQAHIVYPGLVDLTQSMRQNTNIGLRRFEGAGETLYQRLAATPAMEKVFQDAMSSLTLNTNPGMLKSFNFGELTNVLDVGGGAATNAISMVKAFPGLRATVFDMPSVCRMARENIRKNKLEDQVSVIEGDFLSDPFPSGIDGVMFNHILVIWSEERILSLLKKSYAALPKGGAVFIHNMMAGDMDEGPMSPVFGSLYFLAIATGEGMLYRWKDYTALLKQAGFGKIERVENLPLHHGLLIGRKV